MFRGPSGEKWKRDKSKTPWEESGQAEGFELVLLVVRQNQLVSAVGACKYTSFFLTCTSYTCIRQHRGEDSTPFRRGRTAFSLPNPDSPKGTERCKPLQLLLASVPRKPRREKRPLPPNGLGRTLFAVLPIEDRTVVRPEGVLDEAGLDEVVKVLPPVQTPERGTGEFDPVRASGLDESLDVLGGGETVEGIIVELEIGDSKIIVGGTLDHVAETVSKFLVTRLAMIGVRTEVYRLEVSGSTWTADQVEEGF